MTGARGPPSLVILHLDSLAYSGVPLYGCLYCVFCYIAGQRLGLLACMCGVNSFSGGACVQMTMRRLLLVTALSINARLWLLLLGVSSFSTWGVVNTGCMPTQVTHRHLRKHRCRRPVHHPKHLPWH